MRWDQVDRSRRDNVSVELSQKALLKCGHEIRGVPVAVFPGRRKMYRCSECGLQEPKWKH